MAFIKEYKDKFGNTYPDAYWSIIEENKHYLNKDSVVTLGIWKDKQAYLEGKSLLAEDKTRVSGDGTFEQIDQGKPYEGDNVRKILPSFDEVFGDKVYKAKKTNPKEVFYTKIKEYKHKGVTDDV